MTKEEFIQECHIGSTVEHKKTGDKYEVLSMTWGGQLYARPVDAECFDLSQVILITKGVESE